MPPKPRPEPQVLKVEVNLPQPVIFDPAKSVYIRAVDHLRAWAQKEYDAAEALRKKAEARHDQRDRHLALAARDAYGDVLRELGRVEYK